MGRVWSRSVLMLRSKVKVRVRVRVKVRFRVRFSVRVWSFRV